MWSSTYFHLYHRRHYHHIFSIFTSANHCTAARRVAHHLFETFDSMAQMHSMML